MNTDFFNNVKSNSYKFYVRSRNFFINNFFVKVLCLKQNNIYTNIDNSFYQYLLLLVPFYIIKLVANMTNTDIIYKVDGIYGITNIKKNHIIPFITSCTLINNDTVINLTSDIRLYNSSIPLLFFIKHNYLNSYDSIRLTYLIKSNKIEKIIKLNSIDYDNYLIYQMFVD